MPIAKNLSKISKQKATSKLHPRGRKLAQLSRAQLREDKLSAKKALHHGVTEQRLERLKFFQEFCKQLDQPAFTIDDIHAMIEAFVGRDDDEMKKLEQARRPGRPTLPKYDALSRKHEVEEREYREGFNVPDLTKEEVVTRLLEWKGAVGGTNVLGESVRLARGASEFSVSS